MAVVPKTITLDVVPSFDKTFVDAAKRLAWAMEEFGKALEEFVSVADLREEEIDGEQDGDATA